MRNSLSRSAIALLILLGCGDQGPGVGDRRFTMTLDGLSWVPETATAILYGSQCDTTLFLGAARSTSSQDGEAVTIVLHHFSGAASVSLGDPGAPAYGAFALTHNPVGGLPVIDLYRTWSRRPGTLTLQGVTTTDSVMYGSFAFEAALTPSGLNAHRVSGQFRLRYEFQPVFVVEC
jgi:hypothetical protein